jgi:hypothetical protein
VAVNIRAMTRTILPAFLIVFIAGAGCATNVPKYAAPEAAAGPLATLRTEHMNIERVDGLRVDDKHNLLLAAGTHEVECSWTGAGRSGKMALHYDFAPGGRYLAKMEDKAFSFRTPRFILVEENSGKELDSVGGQSIFKVF